MTGFPGSRHARNVSSFSILLHQESSSRYHAIARARPSFMPKRGRQPPRRRWALALDRNCSGCSPPGLVFGTVGPLLSGYRPAFGHLRSPDVRILSGHAALRTTPDEQGLRVRGKSTSVGSIPGPFPGPFPHARLGQLRVETPAPEQGIEFLDPARPEEPDARPTSPVRDPQVRFCGSWGGQPPLATRHAQAERDPVNSHERRRAGGAVAGNGPSAGGVDHAVTRHSGTAAGCDRVSLLR
jgi:hypothetical protein